MDRYQTTNQNVDSRQENEIPVLGIVIAAVLVSVPITACVCMKLIASKCPNSLLGRKLHACRASQALTEE